MARYRSVRNGRRKTPTICPTQRDNRKRAKVCGDAASCPDPTLTLVVQAEEGGEVGAVVFGVPDYDSLTPVEAMATADNVPIAIDTPYTPVSSDTWSFTNDAWPGEGATVQLALKFADGCWLFAAGTTTAA